MNSVVGSQSPSSDPIHLILASSAIRAALDDMVEAINAGDDILVQGASGTGKTTLARYAHDLTSRRTGKAVHVSLADLQESLAQSELFGHCAKAFTGATEARQGLLRNADGGTFIADEFDKAGRLVHALFLRFLDDRRVRPVGADDSVAVDVRFIAVSNRNLAQEAREGRFPPDLFFRLSRNTISIPPLKDRPEDIEPLVRALSARFATARGYACPEISVEAVRLFESAEWPGNIRDLSAAVLQCVKATKGGRITDDIVRSAIGLDSASQTALELRFLAGMAPDVRRTRGVIIRVLELTRWNGRRAAEVLEIPLRTFQRDCRRFGIRIRADE